MLPDRFMILCADDYGMSEDIDRAILELCASGRLSAVSCMVALERCGTEALKPLLEHQAGVDIGLHLCLADETLSGLAGALTVTEPLPSFAVYLRQTLSRRVQARQIARQVAAQYELFLKKCGRTPDFMDGHLHAHQLPGVREGLIEFASSLPAGDRPYLRNTRPPLRDLRHQRAPWLKAAFIGAFGKRMLVQLRAAGLPTNDGFAGIYDFRKWRSYPDYFPAFAACLPGRNGILVVHPGEVENWRRQELATLRAFPFAHGLPNRFQRAAPNASMG